jgi:hypothetical protein
MKGLALSSWLVSCLLNACTEGILSWGSIHHVRNERINLGAMFPY